VQQAPQPPDLVLYTWQMLDVEQHLHQQTIAAHIIFTV
jgi:hypothetical protein